MGQKVIEGGMFLVKSYACDFEMAQLRVGSKSRSRVKTPRWLTFSDLKLAQNSKRKCIRGIEGLKK